MQVIEGAEQGRARRAELKARDRDATSKQEEERRGNSDFVQVYPKGWERLDKLIQDNPNAARVFAFLARNVDGCGAVVVSQDVMAQSLGVHVITIKRQTKFLEDAGALIRIKVGTGVYAYCLDSTEIWKNWDSKKDYAAFTTKTLVAKKDRANGQVKRKLMVMLKEHGATQSKPGKAAESAG